MQIGEVASFQNGYAFKSKDFVQDGKYKIIKIKELKDGKVRFFNDSASVNVDDERIIEKYIAEKGDVLFALTGDPVNKNNPLSWVGRVSVYEDDQLALLNQRVCKLVPKEGLNAKYIYYYFRAFDNFYALASTKDIEAMEIALPSLNIQNKIVSVLDSIAEKINQNNKINKNLEQQAQAIFKSWFIDFHPFGGNRPIDWVTGIVDDLGAEIICGKTPSTKRKEYYGGNTPFITIPDMHGCVYNVSTERYLSAAGVASQPRKTLPPNTVCVSCIGTAGLWYQKKVNLINRLTPSFPKKEFPYTISTY